MAWRIHEAVLCGVIDNRVLGRVKGHIWLQGREQPVTLDLSGNCRRDLAGCLVRFENLKAESTQGENVDLAAQQEGGVGDITASRKVRVFDVPLDDALDLLKKGEKPPEHMGNCFYLEWFSDSNGRVVIESTDYSIEVSTPAWALSPKEEQEQIAATKKRVRV